MLHVSVVVSIISDHNTPPSFNKIQTAAPEAHKETSSCQRISSSSLLPTEVSYDGETNNNCQRFSVYQVFQIVLVTLYTLLPLQLPIRMKVEDRNNVLKTWGRYCYSEYY